MRILGAAIKLGDRIFFKPYPTAYPNIVRHIEKKGYDVTGGEKGFYTSENTFVDAAEALKIVKGNGQLIGIPKSRLKLSIEDMLQIGE